MKTSRINHIAVTAGLALLGICLLAILRGGLGKDPKAIPSALLNQPARGFTVPIMQGKEVFLTNTSNLTLELMRGRPVVLNFWASWCVSCRDEARIFEEFWQKHRTEGVLVVGIAVQDSEAAAMEFARHFGKTYPLGRDVDGHASVDYGVGGVPETFFIDKSGIVRHKEAAPMTLASMERYLELIR